MSTITRRLSILSLLAAAACTEAPTNPIDTGEDTGDSSPITETREAFYLQASVSFGYDGSTGAVTSPTMPGSDFPSMITQVIVFDTSIQSAQSDQQVQDSIMCLLVDASQAPTVDASAADSLMNVSLGGLAFAETSATGFPDCRNELTGDDLATLQALISDGLNVTVIDGVDESAADTLRDTLSSMVVVGAAPSEGGDTGTPGDTGSSDTGSSDTGDTATPEDSGIIASAAPAGDFEILDSATVEPNDVFLTNALTFQGTPVGFGYGWSYPLDAAGEVAVDESGAPYVQHRSMYQDEDGKFTSGLVSMQLSLAWSMLDAAVQ